MLTPKALQTLFTVPALRALGGADRATCAALFEEVTFERGAIIYREGDEGDALYLVVSGGIDVIAGGKTVVRVGPGESFGEAALLSGEPRSATGEAALDCRLLRLSTKSFARLIEIQPQLYRELAALLAHRLRTVIQGSEGRPCEIVLVTGRGPWPKRRRVVVDLATALEAEIGRHVAIVTITARTALPAEGRRRDRPDAVVMGGVRQKRLIHERINAEVSTLGPQVPFLLLDLDESLAVLERDVAPLADTLVVHVVGAPPADLDYPARRQVFLYDRLDGPGPALSGYGRTVLPVRNPQRRRAVERLARHISRRSIGVALGSGAAWGLAHIGVLDVLERQDIPVDFVAGASMGAIVGAHYALGMPPREIEALATRVRDLRGMIRILPQLLYLAADFNVTRPGLFAGDHFQKVLESLGPLAGRTFKDLEIPFRAVATDIETGARVELGEGSLSDAVRASFSAPWVLSPHRVGNHVLIDGGMCDPVPTETARSMGADVVVAVNVVPPLYPQARNPLDVALGLVSKLNPFSGLAGQVPNSFDVVARTLQIMQHELGNDRAGEADVLINPDVGEHWVLEFWNAAPMIAKGREAALRAIPAIREKLQERRGEGTQGAPQTVQLGT